ncbi:MAG TPA: Hsp20/alpha crystallin family protein [Verrucomicrobiota bacterium]|nr:Hsp20/alpha crystallin family protein [Verrucomicrobiota bacterium]HOK77161.1 Hsp20/alpha crystallin family protein [Verrucomicrobiota bacterium]
MVPKVDIFETGDEYLLQADMPGVGKDGIQISLDSNELTIVGHRTASREKAAASCTYLHRESAPVNFRRAFVLDPIIDTNRITAEMDQGVLTVHLPKAEKVKPRLIPVTD